MSTGSYPTGVAVSPDGSRVYVTNSGEDSVGVINTVTNTVVATVSVIGKLNGVAVSPDGSRVYAANNYDNWVGVFFAPLSVMAESASATPCAATSLGKRQIRACWLLLTPSTGWVTRYRAVVFTSGTSTRVGTCKGDPTETSCVIRQSGLAPNTTNDIRVRARIKTEPNKVFWSSFTPIVQVPTDP